MWLVSFALGKSEADSANSVNAAISGMPKHTPDTLYGIAILLIFYSTYSSPTTQYWDMKVSKKYCVTPY